MAHCQNFNKAGHRVRKCPTCSPQKGVADVNNGAVAPTTGIVDRGPIDLQDTFGEKLVSEEVTPVGLEGDSGKRSMLAFNDAGEKQTLNAEDLDFEVPPEHIPSDDWFVPQPPRPQLTDFVTITDSYVDPKAHVGEYSQKAKPGEEEWSFGPFEDPEQKFITRSSILGSAFVEGNVSDSTISGNWVVVSSEANVNNCHLSGTAKVEGSVTNVTLDAGYLPKDAEVRGPEDVRVAKKGNIVHTRYRIAPSKRGLLRRKWGYTAENQNPTTTFGNSNMVTYSGP